MTKHDFCMDPDHFCHDSKSPYPEPEAVMSEMVDDYYTDFRNVSNTRLAFSYGRDAYILAYSEKDRDRIPGLWTEVEAVRFVATGELPK